MAIIDDERYEEGKHMSEGDAEREFAAYIEKRVILDKIQAKIEPITFVPPKEESIAPKLL